MRVFNKEVKGCHECNYNAAEGQCGETWCKFIYKDTDNLDSTNPIHKECPFNKPITKEVIKGFGFLNTKQYSDELVCQKNISEYEFYELSLQEDNRFIIEYWSQERLVAKVLPKETWGCFNIFVGEINNPVELEFILCSIGVIE